MLCRPVARVCLVLVLAALCARPLSAAEPGPVSIREETLTLPTYLAGPPDKNPMFYTHESYQGAQKRIYPYPLQDHLTHAREDKTYKALTLENEYLLIKVLPELGGRLFQATDKTNGYDFFYQQHVIKPALIGMLGAWISGGVEWCAFHHHRNTTFMPVDYTLAENPDGSKTIWFGETERRHRMRWLIGLTLRPGKSYVEATVKFFNRTAQPHSILYWANVAVHVNDQYQVIFPESVQTATYHSKIDFTTWPIAQGKYRGHDYTGVDVSWWKNSPVSNSFFAWQLQDDFMGGYDHGRDAGVVHVADHHIVCGAKLWEWGTGTSGRAWDKILTDEDGPYAELMVGAWSDNQPDYSWIKPYETKTFSQYWYPVRGIGGFKRATIDAAVNLEVGEDGKAVLGFCATAERNEAKALLTAKGRTIFDEEINLAPGAPWRREIALPAGTVKTDLLAVLTSADGRELVAYQPIERPAADELPKPVAPPPQPADIKTTEELYLTGLRVEQIHNPTVDPTEYYREALKRDPGDTRANTALGIHLNKRGLYGEAEEHLRKALERLTADYTRPRDGEAYYQLGLALRGQHREEEAYDAFYRASWDSAYHTPAFYQLAEISCRQGKLSRALAEVNRALATGTLNTKALNLKAAIARRLGDGSEAYGVLLRAPRIDPLDFETLNEERLQHSTERDKAGAAVLLGRMQTRIRGEVQSYLELAADYAAAGLWYEAIDVLNLAVESKTPAANDPLVYYWLGYLREQQQDDSKALACFDRARQLPPDYCFPFRLEEIDVLKAAIAANPKDARAHYYLGNLLYDIQPEAAVAAWEKSRELDGSFATMHRNLGFAYYRAQNDIGRAIGAYEQAIACRDPDPRLFLEIDTLYELGNVDPQRRLTALEKHHNVVGQRQDSLQREITVLVLTGKYDEAIDQLTNNQFHAKEGSEGIHDVYADAHLLRGLARMKAKDYAGALTDFEAAADYPENLAVGGPEREPRAAELAYLAGTAHEALGQKEQAAVAYAEAAKPSERIETRVYQGLALQKLDRNEEAAKALVDLIETGKRRVAEGPSADFFAKFGEQETKRSREASGHFLIGQCLLGQGDKAAAQKELAEAVRLNASNPWAAWWLEQAKNQ